MSFFFIFGRLKKKSVFLNIALVPFTNTVSKIVLLPRSSKITQPDKTFLWILLLEIGSVFTWKSMVIGNTFYYQASSIFTKSWM